MWNFLEATRYFLRGKDWKTLPKDTTEKQIGKENFKLHQYGLNRKRNESKYEENIKKKLLMN